MSLTPAARFIRVSGNTQDEESQVRDTDRAAEREGLMFVMPDFRLHAVSGFKGTRKHLDALDAALEAVRSSQIAAIVVSDSSRLMRLDPDDAMLYAIQIRQAGGRVVSWDEPHFGANDLAGKIFTMFAQDGNYQHSRKLSEHISRKFRWMDDQGSFRGAPPAGYQVEGPKYAKYLVHAPLRREATRQRKLLRGGPLVIVTVTLPSAQDIRDAFTSAANGTAAVTLGAQLGLSRNAMASILRNPVYSTGRYEVKRKNGSVYVYRCEPLVNPDIQKQAITSLTVRWRGDNVSSRAITGEDFSGALTCGHCGGTMYRYFSGGTPRANGSLGPRTRRYFCAKCKKTVKADEADAATHELMSANQLPWVRSRLEQGNDHSHDLARVKDELAGLGTRGLSRQDMRAETDRLYDEIDRLEAMPIIPARIVTEIVRREDGSEISEGAHWKSMTLTERRAHLLGPAFCILVKAAPGRTGAVIVEIEHHDLETEGTEPGEAPAQPPALKEAS